MSLNVVMRLLYSIAFVWFALLHQPLSAQSKVVTPEVERVIGESFTAPSMEVLYDVRYRMLSDTSDAQAQRASCRLLYAVDRRRRDTSLMLSISGKVRVIVYRGRTYELGGDTVVVSDEPWDNMDYTRFIPTPLVSMGGRLRKYGGAADAAVSVYDSVSGGKGATVLAITGPVDVGLPEVNRHSMVVIVDKVGKGLMWFDETFSGSGIERQEYTFTVDSMVTRSLAKSQTVIAQQLRRWKKSHELVPLERLMEDINSRPPSALDVGDTLPGELQRYLSDMVMPVDGKAPKLVLLDFWYMACQPCRAAMPVLDSISTVYRYAGVMVVGINPIDQDSSRVNSLLHRSGVTYPTVLVPRTVAADMKIFSYPTLMLVHAASRRLMWQSSGFGNDVGPLIQTTLSEMQE